MVDKIKTTIQLNNMALTSMQPIDNRNLRFAGKILTKYGVSRRTDLFMALVLRYYSKLSDEATGVERLDSSATIKNYAKHLNIYNRIVNWNGKTIQRIYQYDTRYIPTPLGTYSTEGDRQERNASAEIRTLGSPAGTALLERIFTREKNTLDKIRVSGISNSYLIHNTLNIAHAAVPSGLPSIRNANSGQFSIGKQEAANKDRAYGYRTEAAERMQGFQAALGKSTELLRAKTSDERYIPALLGTYSTEGDRQERNTSAEIRTLGSPAGTALLERIFTREKNTLDKTRVSGISNSYLIHNTLNIAHAAMHNTMPQNIPSFRNVDSSPSGVGKQEAAYKDRAYVYRAETSERVQGSQGALGKGTELLRAKASDERYIPTPIGTSSREGSRQEGNAFTEMRTLCSSAGIALLERIFTREKNTLAKIRVPGISDSYLIHNTLNISNSAVHNTVLGGLPIVRNENSGQLSIGKQEPAFQDRAYLSVQQNIVGLTHGGQYINTMAVKGYMGSSVLEHNRLQPGIQNKGMELNYSTWDAGEENIATDYIPMNELRHKVLYKTEMSQGRTDIVSHNKIGHQGSLVLHKPVIAKPAAEEKKSQNTEFYEKSPGNQLVSTLKQPQAVNNIDSHDISQIADRVFKILEKRIAIQKDRRGLL